MKAQYLNETHRENAIKLQIRLRRNRIEDIQKDIEYLSAELQAECEKKEVSA